MLLLLWECETRRHAWSVAKESCSRRSSECTGSVIGEIKEGLFITTDSRKPSKHSRME